MPSKKLKTLLPFILVQFVALIAFGVLRSLPAKAAAVITVNSKADSIANDGSCTLREAILAANTDTASGVAVGECVAGSGVDTINFNITGTPDFTNDGQDGYRINFTSGMDHIESEMIINGYSQPGAQANTAIAPLPMNGRLLIELDTSSINANTLAFDDGSDNSIIKGLVLRGARASAIRLAAPDVHVQGNYIGTDASGLAPAPNCIGITTANGGNTGDHSGRDALIGGLQPADRNIISGNTNTNLICDTPTAVYPDTGWVIQGNYVGLGADGLTPITNSKVGGAGSFSIDACDDVVVGGAQTGAMNVIGASLGHGIAPDAIDNLTIEGNIIGLAYDGVTILGNIGGGSGAGLATSNMTNSLIKNNNIAGWDGGISISVGDANNQVTGNTVHDNDEAGIALDHSSDALITDNIVTNNLGDGIGGFSVANTTISNNTLTGNLSGISLNEAATTAITTNTITDNNANGIAIVEHVYDTAIGGVNPSDSNTITGNVQAGIASVYNGSDSVFSILNNKINSNGDLGITLTSTSSALPNDDLDSDTGANGLLNYPDNVQYNEVGGNTEMTYDLDVPAGDYRIEYFSNSSADSSGYGEGETFLGSQNVTSAGTGSQAFSHSLTGTSLANISITATDIDTGNTSGFGATSEFSATATQLPPPPPVVDVSVTNTLTNPGSIAAGGTASYSMRYTNNGPDTLDLDQFTEGPFIYLVAPPELIAQHLGDPGPYPDTFEVTNTGNPNLNCLWAAGAYGVFFGSQTYADYGIIVCFSNGNLSSLAAGDSLDLAFDFTIDPSSNLNFGTYAFGAGDGGDPDSGAIGEAFEAGDEPVDIATAATFNNFAAALYSESVTVPNPATPPATLADTGEDVRLLAGLAVLLVLVGGGLVVRRRGLKKAL